MPQGWSHLRQKSIYAYNFHGWHEMAHMLRHLPQSLSPRQIHTALAPQGLKLGKRRIEYPVRFLEIHPLERGEGLSHKFFHIVELLSHGMSSLFLQKKTAPTLVSAASVSRCFVI